MMKQYRFAHTRSVYPLQPDDPKAVVLHVDGLTPDAKGVYDVTERLQALLDSVKQQDKRGIVLIPEGTYSVSRTIYLPRAVRMIGFGKNRPKFVLKKNTPGFQKAPQEDKGEAVYMFWFTGNMPRVEGRIQDANPGTFYSAVSNINFQIEEGNPAADIVMDGYWEKLFWKDCVLENISGPAIQISREDNSCTQINLRNLWCSNVPQLLLGRESGQVTKGSSGAYLLHSLFHGDDLTLGQQEPERKTLVELEPLPEAPHFPREIQDLPPQETWRNVRDFGALGNGVADDTAALQQALDQCDTVYLPQGIYLVRDTLRMREGNALIGLNPISTQLVLEENSPAWAGMGAPKAVLETSRGGWNLVNGLGIDTASRNPRAVGCKWMASANSYMNDVKFVGGHGQITQQQENVPVYNPSRTADVDPDRPWDSQYWSLWITENGGGAFKDVWTANTYAEAGFFISETETPGVMYQVSIEHHVRHEVLMRNVANWQFLCMQTEEEVAEGPYCQPYELTNCRNLLFANFYSFRVIWVDNPYPSVVRAWNCQNLEFLNCHNFTQMKYTIENLYVDGNTGERAGFWQLGRLSIPQAAAQKKLPGAKGEIAKLASGLDCVDALCQAPDGSIYLCDSRLYRIYRWDPVSQTLTLLTSQHFQPLSLACDTQGRLLVVTEYQPVKGSTVDGVEELSTDEFGADTGGGCYYPFFSHDRRIRVCALDPRAPEASMELLPIVPLEEAKPEVLCYPANQWRDSGDMMRSFEKRDTHCYLAPDGKTAIVHKPALARATGLTPLRPGKAAYLVDEYNKCIVQVQVEEGFVLSSPRVWAERGEYGFAMTESGEAYVPDCLLYVFRNGEKVDAIGLGDRPACVLEAGPDKEYLYITARRELYALRLK